MTPAEFVAEGHGRLDAAGGPTVPAVDMEVSAADGGGFDADENFDRAGRRDGYRFDLGAAFGAHLAQCFHFGGRHSFISGRCRRLAETAMLAQEVTGEEFSGERVLGWKSRTVVG